MFNKIFYVLPVIMFSIAPSIRALEDVQKEQPKENPLIKQERYLSKNAGYSIQFPLGWEVMQGVMGTDVIALAPASDPNDLFRENINIIYANLDESISREEYYDLNMKSLGQLLVDYDLEKSEDIKIDGLDAKKIIFTHTMGVVNAKVLQYLLLDGNKAYVMTFTADPLDFDKYHKTFEEIENSFRFEKNKM